jgi:septum site-determining protein MinC
MPNSIVRCVIPEDMPPSEFPSAFGEILEKGGSLLQDAKLVLDFGGRELSGDAIFRLLADFVWPSGVSVAAWITYDAPSQDVLKRAGFHISEPSIGAGPASTLALYRSLRSGQRVEHRGDVIISGHVNDGAEILASGSITILGRLSGLVHAGYEGDESAAVVARYMEAMQVRIGGKIGSLDKDAQWWGKHDIESVRDGAMLIEYWPVVKSGNIKESD